MLVTLMKTKDNSIHRRHYVRKSKNQQLVLKTLDVQRFELAIERFASTKCIVMIPLFADKKKRVIQVIFKIRVWIDKFNYIFNYSQY